jgi:hypothetical protein
MAMKQSLKKLVQQMLDHVCSQRTPILVEVLLEIEVEVFEDEVEFIVTVDDVPEVDDVGVLQLLQKRNFPYSSARDALVRML